MNNPFYETRREYIYLIIILIIAIGFFLTIWQQEKSINIYRDKLIECHNSINLAEKGWLPLEKGLILNLTNPPVP